MKLSNQALGTIMICLQKAILEESDVTEQLRSLNFIVTSTEQLEVENPPTFEVPDTFVANNVATSGSD
tara:strand:- start:29143 stop:29346 length:204 start_codon:yes stop_codon:yes gene_type:complete